MVMAHDGQQVTTDFDLLQQGLWHFGHRAAEHDGVKRGIARSAGAAVSHAHIHVGDASALQVVAALLANSGLISKLTTRWARPANKAAM